MKLSEAAVLCSGNNRAFTEVYKIYNYKDDDDLRAYCDFVIHEPAEWMRGFPTAWKTSGAFSKPRAAFHRLLRAPVVIELFGETYCNQVHGIIWNAFKNHMNSILEKRGSSNIISNDTASISNKSTNTHLTAEVVHGESDADEAEALPPCPPVPATARRCTTPKNSVVYTQKPDLDYKQKFTILSSVLKTLLDSRSGDDENARLRSALSLLLSEYERA